MSVILLQNALGRLPQTRMAEPVNFSLEAGEHIAVMGPNGGGKSCLVDLITGRNLLMQGRLDYDFGPGTRPTAYGNIVSSPSRTHSAPSRSPTTISSVSTVRTATSRPS